MATTKTKTKAAAPAKKAAPAKTAAPAKKAKAAKGGGGGTKESPWQLTTPPGSSAFIAYRDGASLVCKVGSTTLSYQARCLEDLHAMLKKHGEWMSLGGADEQKPAADGSVEAWGRSASNPVKGWYGEKKGFRGRFGVYVPPVMEALGLAELTHDAKNNKMRAK
jgi:hypothetical protein